MSKQYNENIENKEKNIPQIKNEENNIVDCSVCKTDIPIAFSITEIISAKPRKLKHGSMIFNLIISLVFIYIFYYFYFKK